VADFEDVRRIAMALPGSDERLSRERLQWRVGGKLFVWERPLRPREVEELGAGAPDGPILGARVEHLHAKEALLAEEPEICFTTSHFDGHPSVLVRLERIAAPALEEIVTEAWFARAPAKLAREQAERMGSG
jgi:hypothetical protein